jgi:hypothetical protein
MCRAIFTLLDRVDRVAFANRRVCSSSSRGFTPSPSRYVTVSVSKAINIFDHTHVTPFAADLHTLRDEFPAFLRVWLLAFSYYVEWSILG